MRQTNSILNMQQSIINYIQRNIPKEKNNAVSGRIQGNRVIIGNKAYSYVPTIDVYFGQGDYVYCILPDDGNIAAVVGVV